MNTTSLLSYIKSHDHLAFVLPCGNLRVRGTWTQGTRYCSKTGRNRVVIGRTWETVPASLKAVREWLGY